MSRTGCAAQIAAITFTNKAAREMRQRIAKRLKRKAAEGLTVNTFHSLGWAILRAEPKAAGLKKDISMRPPTWRATPPHPRKSWPASCSPPAPTTTMTRTPTRSD